MRKKSELDSFSKASDVTSVKTLRTVVSGNTAVSASGAPAAQQCCYDVPGVGRLTHQELEDMSQWSAPRLAVRDLVQHRAFGASVLLVIVVNTGVIAVQTDRRLGVDGGYTFGVVDNLFLGVYLAELFLKMYAFRGDFFRSGWNVFDMVVVLISVAEVAWTVTAGSFAGFNPSVFRLLRLIRAVRALRALRVLRTITFFQHLQIIVTTLVRSIPAWSSVALLLVLCLYIFAIVGVTLYGQAAPDDFGNLWKAMFSLFRLITLDNWYDLYTEVSSKSGGESFVVYVLFFIVLETFIYINLLVAVIVNNLERLQQRNAEINRERQHQLALRKNQQMLRSDSIGNMETFRSAAAGPVEDPDAALPSGVASAATRDALGILAALERNIDDWNTLQKTMDELVDAAAA